MNIRDNLINSTQPALVVKAILISFIITSLLVTVEWYVKKDARPFQSILINDIDQLLAFIAFIVAGIYIAMLTYVLYAKCNNLGWKRLAIIVAIITGSIGAFIMFDHERGRIGGEEMFLYLVSALCGYITVSNSRK